MKLAGSYKLNIKKEIVWQALNDTNILEDNVFLAANLLKKKVIQHF